MRDTLAWCRSHVSYGNWGKQAVRDWSEAEKIRVLPTAKLGHRCRGESIITSEPRAASHSDTDKMRIRQSLLLLHIRRKAVVGAENFEGLCISVVRVYNVWQKLLWAGNNGSKSQEPVVPCLFPMGPWNLLVIWRERVKPYGTVGYTGRGYVYCGVVKEGRQDLACNRQVEPL